MMFNDDKIKNVSELLAKRMENVSEQTVKTIARRVKRIGELTPSDAHALMQLSNIGADIDKITGFIATETGTNIASVESMYRKFAQEAYDATEIYYNASGTKKLPFEANSRLQAIIKAQADVTKDSFRNISNTTAIRMLDKSGAYVNMSIEEAYQAVVDKSIVAINSGVADYKSEMRSTMRQLVDSGVRTVEYASGYSRNIASATRMNILDGVRQLNMSIRMQAGEEFGADGVEISAHELCAVDHLDIQGMQFTNKEFEDLNDELDRPIGTCNCQHSIFPIIIGVSKPSYTSDELQEMRNNTLFENINIDGKMYSKYGASQLQRRLENQIRKELMLKRVLDECGDDEGVKISNDRIRKLKNKYSEVSSKAELTQRRDRMWIPKK